MKASSRVSIALFATTLGCAEASAAPATFTFPAGGIIQSVVVSNAAPCAGRQVLVGVVAHDPADPGGRVDIYVDGAPGQPQLLQYFAVNPARKVSIYAITRSRQEDRQEITLSIQQCPAVKSTLELLHAKNPFRRDRVDFRAVLRRGKARQYHWSFGDGTTASTREPFVSHDYGTAMTDADKFSYFNVVVTETATGLVSGRRIAVGSSYALSKSMGFVQADVQANLTRTSQGFAVGLVLTNHHTTPITLNRYLKQYLPCDYRTASRFEEVAAESVLGDNPAIQHPAGPRVPGYLTINKGATVTGRLVMPLERIPPGTCALGFNLIGTSDDRQDVYGSFYVKVRPNPEFVVPVTDSGTLAALDKLEQQLQLPDPDEVDVEQLYLLEQRGLIERTRRGWRKK